MNKNKNYFEKIKNKINPIVKNSVFYLKKNYYRFNFKLRVLFPLIIILIFIDIITKLWAKHSLQNAGEKNFINWFINWNYLLNSGSAKGMWADESSKAITIAVITTICILIAFIFVNQTSMLIAFSLMIGGSMGNTLGRAFAGGSVIDFIAWGTFMNIFPNLRLYSFNLADVFVYVGVIFLMILIILSLIEAAKEYSAKKYSPEKYAQHLEMNTKLLDVKKYYENQKWYPIPVLKKMSYKEYLKQRNDIKNDYKGLDDTRN
ncbi:signal peptidase II [Spiroplasma endosymbiont of Crioceris asparagi]|uniref:signal peptidase II n=1 Tax=Spiroplasma endosymbiont of Crioceris asparagi TaxID=3066286 RepID=UPI0030CE154B